MQGNDVLPIVQS